MARARKPVAGKTRKVKRAIGRPSDPNHVVGRDALVRAACELLKTMPPNEVSGVKIARHCGADPSLIRYYFQDRLGLLIAAAEKLTTEFNPEHAVVAEASAEDQFRARLRRVLELDAANPFFHRLMLEELLASDKKPARELLENLAQRGVSSYRSVLGNDTGGEMADADVEMLFVAVVGICQSFHSVHKLYQIVAGHKVERDDFLDKYHGFLSDLLLKGLLARA